MQMSNSVFEVVKYTKSSLPKSFLDDVNNKRHNDFIKKVSKDTYNGDSVVYALTNNAKLAGFISVCCASFDDIPALNINYLYVSKEFRKTVFNELDNTKVSTFLISFAYQLASKIKEQAGLRWLTLTPDNDDLEDYYLDEHKFLSYKNKSKNKTLFIKI